MLKKIKAWINKTKWAKRRVEKKQIKEYVNMLRGPHKKSRKFKFPKFKLPTFCELSYVVECEVEKVEKDKTCYPKKKDRKIKINFGKE